MEESRDQLLYNALYSGKDRALDPRVSWRYKKGALFGFKWAYEGT